MEGKGGIFGFVIVRASPPAWQNAVDLELANCRVNRFAKWVVCGASEHPHGAAILDDRAAISDEWLAKEAHRAANSDDLFHSCLQKVVTARKMAPFCQPGCNPPATCKTACDASRDTRELHGVHFLLIWNFTVEITQSSLSAFTCQRDDSGFLTGHD